MSHTKPPSSSPTTLDIRARLRQSIAACLDRIDAEQDTHEIVAIRAESVLTLCQAHNALHPLLEGFEGDGTSVTRMLD